MRSLASPPPQWLSDAIARRGVGLEDELRTDLTDTTRCSRSGLTELAAVGAADHTAGKEVGVVEDVESFGTELETKSVGDAEIPEGIKHSIGGVPKRYAAKFPVLPKPAAERSRSRT